MAHANNRAAAKPRASFQLAGGTICKYRHPFLSGQINGASPVDEIDVSRAMKLSDTFLDAQPVNDSSFQEVLVDGSTVTITNHLMNGEMTLQVLRTTGLVGTGDLIAAAHLVIASKDDIGGTFTVIETINGKRIVTIFWGVSWKRVPHLKKAGNSPVVYPITMLYAGWVQGVSANQSVNEKTIWAVGNKTGLTGVYKPYGIQGAEDESGRNFYSGEPVGIDFMGYDVGTDSDSAGGDLTVEADNLDVPLAVVPTTMPFGMASAKAGPTWKE